MLRFEVIHNIPSPYRLHMFRVMARDLTARGVTMRVHFMAQSHSDRPKGWATVDGDLGFASVFHQDRGFRLGGRALHWNPSVLTALRAERPDWLLVGGPWDSVTAGLVTMVSPRRRGIAWFESNTQTPGRLGFPLGNFKRMLLRRYQVFAVPGQDGVAYTKLLFGGGELTGTMAVLPNIIDETVFKAPLPAAILAGRQFFRAIGVPAENRVAFWPARLVEAKGIQPMLRVLAAVAPKGWSVVLLGEGPLREQIVATIAELGLGDIVRVVPYLDYAAMPGLYHASSLFLLASMHDPNPLSIVEAMHSGLPLLVSRRIGNFAEALQEGANGWAFDPTDAEAAILQAKKTFAAEPERLSQMGGRSRILARKSWDSEATVARFLDLALGPKLE